MTPIIPQKPCIKCGIVYPSTSEFFYKDGDGLRNDCKICFREYQRLRRQLPHVKEYERQRGKTEHRKEYARNFNQKPERKQYLSDYARSSRGRNVHNRHNNSDGRKAYLKKRRETQEYKTYMHDYVRSPEKKPMFRVYHQNRRARLLELPDTFTIDQWRHALGYFNNCCAVCQRPLDFKKKYAIAADHWIPITHPDCTGTVATNIVPLCHGAGGCNNSKKGKLPDVWLAYRYGADKANEIMCRVRDYFDSL